jgi:hypothetical protein
MSSQRSLQFAVYFFACSVAAGLRAEVLDTDDRASGGLRSLIQRFDADRGNLGRYYSIPLSEHDRKRREAFYRDWHQTLKDIDFDRLSRDAQVDYLLFRDELIRTQQRAAREDELDAAVLSLIPFRKPIIKLLVAHRRLEPVEGKTTAARLADIERQIDAAREKLEDSIDDAKKNWDKDAADRAARRVRDLSGQVGRWFGFYKGYDPIFTWWVNKPAEDLRAALDAYAKVISDELAKREVKKKPSDPDKLVGYPIGAEALTLELKREMISYSPAELVKIANHEFAWCDREMAKAARALGFGADWRKAQDFVKTRHVEPGQQPKLIKHLALEAVQFLESRELITIPPLSKETWRMQMMSASRQRVNPYFTGGEVISVSFPNDELGHHDKLMSMRGNNVHFARATVHHELIPGHHLQDFMNSRHRPYRRRYRTPFWHEGWAVYWEMRMWELDFPRSPEDRIGMLFWLKHRCARIIFSLGFHLETMTPDECVDFLVQRVGHERRNATAEVRRSIGRGYSPLYQAAYMLGALQFRALQRKLVGGGKMTERQFHDAVMRLNSIPVEMVRASLDQDVKLTPDYVAGWEFAKKGASR